MQHKLLWSIFAMLLLVTAAFMAGCGDDDEGKKAPALDWTQIVGYDAADGDRVLGTATAELDGTGGRYQETVLGNCIIDGIAEYARHAAGGTIDFALHNDLFMRNNPKLLAGDITNSAITGIAGMTDILFVSDFTGEQVSNVIDGFVKSTTSGSWSRNCAVMVSKEVSYTIDGTTNPPRATNIKVKGAAINLAKDYRIAVGNFIGDNTSTGRFLPVLDESKKRNYTVTLGQAFAMYVLAKGTLNPADYPLGRYTGVVPQIQ